MSKLMNEVMDKATCLYNFEQVNQALDIMADKMEGELSNENPVFLMVMTGASIPAGHLLTRLNFPMEIDYVHATRYQGELTGSELAWRAEPKTDLEGRTVVVFDDILDKGVTLSDVVSYCEDKNAGKIYTAVLVDKNTTRDEQGLAQADFVALEVEDKYVFGFGLDYKEYLRNAPGIYAVAPEHAA